MVIYQPLSVTIAPPDQHFLIGNQLDKVFDDITPPSQE
jgi:hypothetical protein